MNCYFHQDRAAVTQCQGCGKYLCKECAEKYNKEGDSHNFILCDACYLEHIKGYRKSFFKKFGIGVLLAIIGCFVIGNVFFEGIGYAFFLILLPYGWIRKNVSETEAALRATGNVRITLWDLVLFVLKIGLSVILCVPFFIRDVVRLIKSIRKEEKLSSGTLL